MMDANETLLDRADKAGYMLYERLPYQIQCARCRRLEMLAWINKSMKPPLLCDGCMESELDHRDAFKTLQDLAASDPTAGQRRTEPVPQRIYWSGGDPAHVFPPFPEPAPPAPVVAEPVCPLCQRPVAPAADPHDGMPAGVGYFWYWRGEKAHRACVEPHIGPTTPLATLPPSAPVVAKPARCAQCGAEEGYVKLIGQINVFGALTGRFCVDCDLRAENDPNTFAFTKRSAEINPIVWDKPVEAPPIPNPLGSRGWHNRPGFQA